MTKAIIYLDAPPTAFFQQAQIPMPGTKRHLITFHSGHLFSLAAERLARQAQATGWFSSVNVLHPGANHAAMQAFETDHGEFARLNPRGYGYWQWKPVLIQSLLKALPEDAHLYYMDAGCELSNLGSSRFAALDHELAERGVLCFEIDFTEFGWCKYEAVEAILGTWREPIMTSRQIQATWFGLRNTDPVRKIITEWAAWATQDNLITDDHNPARQHPEFRAHRHDQALWSLTLKKHGVRPLPQEDCFEKWLYVRNSWVLLAPVHGLRSRGRQSRIDGIIKSSSADSCINNITSPSLQFKSQITASRLRIQVFNWLRRTLSQLRDAFH